LQCYHKTAEGDKTLLMTDAAVHVAQDFRQKA